MSFTVGKVNRYVSFGFTNDNVPMREKEVVVPIFFSDMNSKTLNNTDK